MRPDPDVLRSQRCRVGREASQEQTFSWFSFPKVSTHGNNCAGPPEGREKYFPSQKGSRDLWFPGAFFSLAMLPVRPENLQKVYKVSLRIFRFLHQDSCLCKNVNAHAWPGNIKSPASRAARCLALRHRLYVPKIITVIASISLPS